MLAVWRRADFLVLLTYICVCAHDIFMLACEKSKHFSNILIHFSEIIESRVRKCKSGIIT